MKILTIGIPTYNRAKELLKTLENLSKETGFENINIYISDNGSIDNTTHVVQTFIEHKGYKNIFYSKNSENIGFDRNVLKCYNECVTDYIWILSDDDKVIDGSLETLTSQLLESSIICLNDIRSNGSLGLIPFKKSLNSKNENERWEAISKFVWISRFVVKKFSIDENLLGDYIGTGLMHLAIINHILIRNDNLKFTITNYPVLINQPHCIFSHNFTDVFVNQFFKFCCLPQSGFSKKLSHEVARANIPFVVDGFLSHKVGTKIFKYNFRFFYLINKMIRYEVEFKLIVKFIIIYLIPKTAFQFFKKPKAPCVENLEKRTYI